MGVRAEASDRRQYVSDGEAAVQRLREYWARFGQPVIITGAGCSTESGIPDYRDHNGAWKRAQPMQAQTFLKAAAARRRYWARSFIGWPTVAAARPNTAHRALARLEAAGQLGGLITQNVDGLHAAAGSRWVIELHGSLHRVVCRDCGILLDRTNFQADLAQANPGWHADGTLRPDGDAEIATVAEDSFRVPDCPQCAGLLKPDVVFFGENVPRERVEAAFQAVRRAGWLLIAGSSLMVWSGYRFVREAHRSGAPIVAVNLGRTRADGEITEKMEVDCTEVLPRVAEALAGD